MPGYNGTGPQGRGAMTGRGLGRCRRTYPLGSVIPSEEIPEGKENDLSQPVQLPVTPDTPVNGNQVFGVGRGGIPFGCGNGFAKGSRGGRRGRCFR